MSVADPPSELARTAAETFPTLRHPAQLLVAGLAAVLQGVAFWVAALLPLAYLPLLATGIVAEHPLGFLGLVAANGVAFVVGHTHDPVA